MTHWPTAHSHDDLKDYMHLVAARKSNATVIHTLNMDDFMHLRRGDDPEVQMP